MIVWMTAMGKLADRSMKEAWATPWILYQILKDADALDRVRFSIYDLDVNQLRLPISHRLVPLAVTALTRIKI